MVNASLYMSGEAREHYGPLTRQFESWLEEQGIRHAVIMSASDFSDHPNQAKTIEPMVRITELESFIGQFSAFPQGVISKDIGGISLQTHNNKPTTYGYDSDGDGVRDTVVIITHHRDATKLEIASDIASIPQNELKNLTGTDFDWQVFVIAHEIGHAGQNNHNKTSLAFETGADIQACLFWRRAYAAGLVTSESVPTEFINMRALAAFSPERAGGLITHFTSAVISLEGGAVSSTLNEDAFVDAWFNITQMVAQEAGHNLITDESLINILRHVVDKSGLVGMRMESADFSLSQKENGLMTDIIDGKVLLKEGLEQLDVETRTKIQGYLTLPETSAGLKEFRENPHLMHETIRRMHLDGRFDDNPIGKQYAHDFLTASRQHAMEYYGVHDYTTNYVAPVFDSAEPHAEPCQIKMTF